MDRDKGAPGRESRTGTRLVRLRKKEKTPLEQGPQAAKLSTLEILYP